MKNTMLTVVWGSLLAAAAQAQGRGPEPSKPAETPKCDVKKTDNAKYCETCYQLRSADQLKDDDLCKTCSNKVKEVEVCVKEAWICPKCGAMAAKDGICATEACKKEKVKAEKKESRCLVIYRCKGTCMQSSRERKKCETAACKAKGQFYEKSCEQSGQPPHVKKK